jgi:hypothetical protein
MRDSDVRPTLRDWLSSRYCREANSLIIEELGLCQGSARADFAVVNGALKGFELKSQTDTLARLEHQVSTYSLVFDTASLIAAERHIQAARKTLPRWWGIYAIRQFRGSVSQIEVVREEKPNTSVDPTAVVQLLWRDEAIELLDRISPGRNRSNLSRRLLWAELVDTLAISDLRDATRVALKLRRDWRAEPIQMQHGETCRLCATSSDSPAPPFVGRIRRYSRRPS